jgi:hypothetical protein
VPDFPILDEQARVDAVEAIHALKEEYQFDHVLGEIISARLAHSTEVRHYHRFVTRAIPILIALIAERVNPHIVIAILDGNPLYGHNVPVKRARASKQAQIYILEDRAKRILRQIVESIYDEADSDLHRKKVTGTMGIVSFVLNQQDFIKALRQAGIHVR